MESSSDGDEVEVTAEMARRWADVGRVIARLAPELFRRTVLAMEVTAVTLSAVGERLNG